MGQGSSTGERKSGFVGPRTGSQELDSYALVSKDLPSKHNLTWEAPSTSYSQPHLQSPAHLHTSTAPTNSFTYQELQKATDDFSNHNVLGWDGSSYVYLGTLFNTQVMIKDFQDHDDTGFLSEVLVIARTNHPNILKMLGYCVGAGFKMLVLELVPNNTLDFHLYGGEAPCISWENRMKIALGVAKGLAYLHEDCDPSIIHRNIKLSNILLDFDFEPKIAGFNFATKSSVSRAATRSGNMLPDYSPNNRHSEYDVFSFGFILLELITGKKPFFSTVDQSPHVATSILPPLKNALNKCDYTALVDPRLGNQYSKEEMGIMIHCTAACLYKLERNRPRMKEIVQVLEGDMSMKLLWQHEKDKHYLRPLLC
ncbi:Protein kinase superfamily protein [Euphorbia peplus]|nr:Protein kinase superfamily protein [Euphorbia peplus]